MKNFTLALKQSHNTLVQTNKLQTASVAYNPNKVTGDPNANAIAAGWAVAYSEVSANWIEIIYTRSTPSTPSSTVDDAGSASAAYGGTPAIDAGAASSIYGGTPAIDGGHA